MKIVAISDTHNKHKQIQMPEGDLLIVAGDVTSRGKFEEIGSFLKWYREQDFKYKVFVPGNHDFCFDPKTRYGQTRNALIEQITSLPNSYYLEDSWIMINDLKIYGTPYQPYFCDWAFNIFEEDKLLKKWQLIPSNIDILITHCPAYNTLDKLEDGELVGCKLLRKELNRIQPKYHIFGHIHCSYGKLDSLRTKYYNVAICNEEYKVFNKPTEIMI